MNIFNSYLLSSKEISLFKEHVFSGLSSKQKQITLLAVGILSCVFLCLTAYRCIQSRKAKPVVTPQKVEKKLKVEQAEKKADAEWRTMTIYIKSMTGKQNTYKVASSDTIYSLKELIQEREGIPPDQNRLVHAGRLLENDRTFADYRIVKESALHMFPHLRGD
jgi:hypothetical protein